jgi:hypothetical protein
MIKIMTGIVYKPLGVQFEDYTTCDSALKVCRIQSVDQVLDQHLTRPEEEEDAEHKATFLDELKEWDAVGRYMRQSDTESNIIVNLQ